MWEPTASECVTEFDLPVAATPLRYKMRAHLTLQHVSMAFFAVYPFYRWTPALPASGSAAIDLRHGFGTQEVSLRWVAPPAVKPDAIQLLADEHGAVVARVRVSLSIPPAHVGRGGG